jgi:hypothetical protein
LEYREMAKGIILDLWMFVMAQGNISLYTVLCVDLEDVVHVGRDRGANVISPDEYVGVTCMMGCNCICDTTNIQMRKETRHSWHIVHNTAQKYMKIMWDGPSSLLIPV